MAQLAGSVKYSNESGSIGLQPYTPANADPAAMTEYNAATISGIAFGIFMALLALYTIWQYGRQHSVFVGLFLQQHRHSRNPQENADIENGARNSRMELDDIEGQTATET